MDNPLSRLPSIKYLQDCPEFNDLLEDVSINKNYLTQLTQECVDCVRHKLVNDRTWALEQTTASLTANIFSALQNTLKMVSSSGVKQVINGTGVVLHTNLGRARLSSEAAQAAFEAALGYSNLEFDLTSGKRGSRTEHLEALLTRLTGAEAALVVNNNAAAVFLVLRALAKRREVIVSRGELVEIGGSFRISSIMEESDAHLVEVGTTNKTHLTDYQAAIHDETAMILKVHQSNFKMIGFTSSVSREELVTLAHQQELLFYEDLGSGALFPFSDEKIGEEPVVSEIIKSGVDLVSLSGDKLLGGPQAGIILGKKKYIERLKKHQLMRTLRVDKMTLAALTVTLQNYFNPETLKTTVPTIRDIVTDKDTLYQRAEKLAEQLKQIIGIKTEIKSTYSYVGGGTMPEIKLKSYAVVIICDKIEAMALAKALRLGNPAVVGRIEDDQYLLDIRTINDLEIEGVYKAVHNGVTNS
ncbi:L-seryl-tRNA(Ser) seleniumtransferase [Pullulanibacillus pueri]|uniref:L-seryl-tRNA(Sec) selenium transferase n=1 Tax=Pullulanibacillus pueri TaxID=1437324 RepID=A0A8J2ZWC5_9BACL|nr:L-seryl-tRNA(Sec) selenium transferase [Pullulanibacillus pueri]MBM7682294.1 L-seryl-tRNA(Ser) seleniumtransferase [Pullulanibacillus pueri]GGH80910.1 L-seryl-tRNA(Sec) selenium transferase [Pullulanibacillus pueri]